MGVVFVIINNSHIRINSMGFLKGELSLWFYPTILYQTIYHVAMYFTIYLACHLDNRFLFVYLYIVTLLMGGICSLWYSVIILGFIAVGVCKLILLCHCTLFLSYKIWENSAFRLHFIWSYEAWKEEISFPFWCLCILCKRGDKAI